jgi:hypothetical protein
MNFRVQKACTFLINWEWLSVSQKKFVPCSSEHLVTRLLFYIMSETDVFNTGQKWPFSPVLRERTKTTFDISARPWLFICFVNVLWRFKAKTQHATSESHYSLCRCRHTVNDCCWWFPFHFKGASYKFNLTNTLDGSCFVIPEWKYVRLKMNALNLDRRNETVIESLSRIMKPLTSNLSVLVHMVHLLKCLYTENFIGEKRN